MRRQTKIVSLIPCTVDDVAIKCGCFHVACSLGKGSLPQKIGFTSFPFGSFYPLRVRVIFTYRCVRSSKYVMEESLFALI